LADLETPVTALFPFHEVVMLALFVVGLMWLLGDLAMKDLKSVFKMFGDSEAFARAPTERPGFRVSRFRPAGVLETLQTKLATARSARKS
jgi:hypothetical protein